MYSYQNKAQIQNNKNCSLKNKSKASGIEIEYEKISPKENSKFLISDENENFNVYFMKPDFKYKTISNSNSLTSTNAKKFQQSKKGQNKEKEFKSHLIQKLKSLKLSQNNKDKIPLNIASKIRREESIRNSLKYLLAKQAQYDPKKELMYYKAYFRFWKRKSKMDKDKSKKIIRKDKNIRITTVIYRADKPNSNFSNKIIIDERKNERNGKKSEFFRNKLIRIMESKSKDKINKKHEEEKNEYNSKDKEINKDKIKNLNSNININKHVYPNNIRTIKNNYNEEKNIENKNIVKNMNDIYSQNKKNELSNNKRKALNIINNGIKKGCKSECFRNLKKIRNISRKKEGTEKLSNVFLNKKKQFKEEAISKIKQNIKEIDNFNVEGEKWTVNKFNWQIGELNKDNDSLYGLSEEELKESINQNNINISQQKFESNNILQNEKNNAFIKYNNVNNNKEMQKNMISKNKIITSQPLSEKIENDDEEEIYEMISNDENGNLENNDIDEEEYINYEEMENNNFDNNDNEEEYNYEEGNEENNYDEENMEEEYIDNEMEEEVNEGNENYDENGINYLNDEAEEMVYEDEEEGNDEENNENL